MTVATTTEVEERHSREAIEAEIARFEERVHQLRRGEISEQQFRPFRLKHGTYGQRQPGFQMLRIKVAAGVLKPSQLRVLARIADEYSTGRGHLTTRENVHFHFVKLENVPVAMRLLADCGDRKSTRLNSSHLGTSYAVFCLKRNSASSHHSVARGGIA